jgi:hypothetical protein
MSGCCVLELIQVREGDIAVDNRQNFAKLAQALSELDTTFEPPVWHYQAKGLFGRRAFAPAGSCILTLVHKQEHFTVALSGRCLVVDQDGNKTEVEAPNVWVTQPGTQRALIALTDVEWFCAYAHEDGIPEDPESTFCRRREQCDGICRRVSGDHCRRWYWDCRPWSICRRCSGRIQWPSR